MSRLFDLGKMWLDVDYMWKGSLKPELLVASAMVFQRE
ncbi:hypothetical protein DCCM_3820 [Desulfocucumis palustris]|uniref:Uncharacterized protein n=1 Tax=Desulfocucumis palustris TaxID=1898651 RepID=A0A2L2XEW4_9FIRM|nr:hypothetical protein DCCM_3820 [Desulfocucumis palustris]